MPNPNGISLTAARELENHLIAITEQDGLKPVTIAIMDRAGNLVTLTRQDGAMPATIPVVISKGKTALAFDRDTIELADWPPERILNAKGALPEFTTWGGATKIHKDGTFIGVAIVSGLSQEEDHELSKQRPAHWASGPTAPVPDWIKQTPPSGAPEVPVGTGGGTPRFAPGALRSGNA